MTHEASAGVFGSELAARAGRRGVVRPLRRLGGWMHLRRWWVAGGLGLVYLAGFTGEYRPLPDASGFLTMAHSLARGEGLADPLGGQRVSQPGFPWMAAAVFRVAGFPSFALLHALMLAWLAGWMAAAWAWAALTLGRRWATVFTAGLALTETVMVYGYYLMPDLPFAAGFTLALLGYERLGRGRGGRGRGLAELVMGVAIMGLFRSVVITALAGLGLGAGVELWRRRGEASWRQVLTRGAAAAGLALGAYLAVRRLNPVTGGGVHYDEQFLSKLLTERLPETLRLAFTEQLPKLLRFSVSRAAFGLDFGALAYGFSLWVLGCVAWLGRRMPVAPAVVAVFVAQWLLVYVDRRYVLPLMPLLWMGWWRASVTFERVRSGRPWLKWLGLLAVGFWVGCNAARAGVLIYQQRSFGHAEHYDKGDYERLEQVGRELARRAQGEPWVVMSSVKQASTVMLWSDLRVSPVWSKEFAGAEAFVLTPIEEVRLRSLKRRQGLEPGELLFEVARCCGREPWRVWRLREVAPVGKAGGKPVGKPASEVGPAPAAR